MNNTFEYVTRQYGYQGPITEITDFKINYSLQTE